MTGKVRTARHLLHLARIQSFCAAELRQTVGHTGKIYWTVVKNCMAKCHWNSVLYQFKIEPAQ